VKRKFDGNFLPREKGITWGSPPARVSIMMKGVKTRSSARGEKGPTTERLLLRVICDEKRRGEGGGWHLRKGGLERVELGDRRLLKQ